MYSYQQTIKHLFVIVILKQVLKNRKRKRLKNLYFYDFYVGFKISINIVYSYDYLRL